MVFAVLHPKTRALRIGQYKQHGVRFLDVGAKHHARRFLHRGQGEFGVKNFRSEKDFHRAQLRLGCFRLVVVDCSNGRRTRRSWRGLAAPGEQRHHQQQGKMTFELHADKVPDLLLFFNGNSGDIVCGEQMSLFCPFMRCKSPLTNRNLPSVLGIGQW